MTGGLAGKSAAEAESRLMAEYKVAKTELDPEPKDFSSAARRAWNLVDRDWLAT